MRTLAVVVAGIIGVSPAVGITAASRALAATYALTSTDGTTTCILWDGVSPYRPPVGASISAEPVANCVTTPATASNPATITALQFLQRFTVDEQVAVQGAVGASPVLAVPLTTGLAAGQVTLTDPAVKAWMDGLVAAGAVSADRETAILTP